MGQPHVTQYKWDDIPKEQLTDSLARRLITGDHMMLAHVYLKKGCVIPRHSHENEQLTYILEGALHFYRGAASASSTRFAPTPCRMRAQTLSKLMNG